MSDYNKEIINTLGNFIKEYNISISDKDLSFFINKEKEKRSLKRLPIDIIKMVSSYLIFGDSIALFILCKEYFTHLNYIKKFSINKYFKNNTFNDFDSIEYRWLQVALHDHYHQYNINPYYKNRIIKIIIIEKCTIYVSKQLETFKKIRNPTPNESLAIKTCEKQINAELEIIDYELELIKENCKLSIYNTLVFLLSKCKLYTNILEPDSKLYGGITAESYINNMNYNDVNYDDDNPLHFT